MRILCRVSLANSRAKKIPFRINYSNVNFDYPKAYQQQIRWFASAKSNIKTHEEITEILEKLENKTKRMNWTKVHTLSNEIIERHNDDAQLLTRIGKYICKEHIRDEGAVPLISQLLDRAIELDSSNYDAVYWSGQVFDHIGKLEAALICYRQALELSPNSVECLTALGMALTRSDKYREAIKALLSALELVGGKSSHIINLIGGAYTGYGKVDMAINWFERSLKLDPTNISTYEKLGYLLNRKNQSDKEMKLYEQALSINPKAGVIFQKIGNILMDQQKIEEAIENYLKAIEYQPENPDNYTKLGHAYLTKDDMDDAIKCFNKAIEVDPTDPNAHNNLASAYLSMGQSDKAKHILKTCLELHPNDNATLFNLASVYNSSNNPAKGLQYLNQIQSRNEQETFLLEQMKAVLENDLVIKKDWESIGSENKNKIESE
eukprot:TRINITY_DN7220_c0_g1_i1.p1 TRINITY_DN7220_c0_g1~~TRINITY_DN7220_c0_g1_i1.p1  ORF type:complete len:435 (-),score=61.52 TRINITY_DN7220_c0_g1_i1:4-1308(-)